MYIYSVFVKDKIIYLPAGQLKKLETFIMVSLY